MRLFYIICNVDCRIFCAYFNLQILFGFSFPGLSPLWLLSGPCSVCCHLGDCKNFWLIDWLNEYFALIFMSSFDLDNSFVDELYVTLPSVLIYSKTMSSKTSTLSYFLYKLITDRPMGVQDTFPNVAIALRMYRYLILMVTNCSAERSFSKLKLIEEHPWLMED